MHLPSREDSVISGVHDHAHGNRVGCPVCVGVWASPAVVVMKKYAGCPVSDDPVMNRYKRSQEKCQISRQR